VAIAGTGLELVSTSRQAVQKIEKAAMQYIIHGLEGFMQNRSQEGLSRPRDDEILECMETSGVESFVTNLAVGGGYADLHPPKPGCWLEVCRVQPWDGSSDVAGVGVRRMFNLFITVSLTITDAATYTLQTCLVTVYLFALVMIRIDWNPIKIRNVSFMKRTSLVNSTQLDRSCRLRLSSASQCF
jgi:hypothetical protein